MSFIYIKTSELKNEISICQWHSRC